MSVAGLLALVVVTVLVLLRSLDQPWLKGRLQRLVQTAAGVEIDYQALRVDPTSGLSLEGLLVRSPAEVRTFAPELVRVGRAEARWSLGALLRGRGPALEDVRVSDVTLTVVVDERGRTSFDALSPSSSTAPASPSVPLSHQASTLLGAPLPVGRFAVDRVTLALVQTESGVASERIELKGLALGLASSSAEPTARGGRVDLALGSRSAPLELVLTRAPAGAKVATARAKLWLTLGATSSTATAALDVRMIEQTFAASVSADHWLHAEASVRFDPTQGRTEVTLDHTEAGDGAATADASLEIPDTGSLIVRHAHGDVDVARLLHWLPAGLVPVTAERARVRAQVDSLVVAQPVSLAKGGAAEVDAELSKVAAGFGGSSISVSGGQLSLHATPLAGGGIAGRGAVTLTGTRLASGTTRIAADDVGLELDGQQGGDGVVAGRAAVRFASIAVEGASPVLARDGHVELRAEGVHVSTEDPLATRAISLSTELGSLDVRTAAAHATVDRLVLRAHTTLDGHAPYAAELDASVSRLRALGRAGDVLVDAPVHIETRGRDVLPDRAHPVASRGVVHAAIDVGDIGLTLEATKGADAVDYALRATARSLKAVRPFLPPAVLSEAPWDQIAVTLLSSGHVEHLGGGALSIRHTTDVAVERLAFENVVARSLALKVTSQGTAMQHKADVDLRAHGLAFSGGTPSDDHVTLSATVDRSLLALQFQLATEGRAATKLSGSLSFDPSRRALPYEIEGHLAGLAPLAPLAAKVPGLEAFDLSQLDVSLSAHGALLGVIASVTRSGVVTLEPNPMRTAALEGKADLHVAHFHWSKGDTAITTPNLAWHGEMRAVGDRRSVDSRLDVGTMHLDLGSKDVDLNGINDDASVTVTGTLASPEMDLTQHLSVHGVEQDVVPEYPLGDLDFALSATRGGEGVVHISDMKVANGKGGTALALTGNVDLGEGRRTLSVTTQLTQDLARLSTIPERFKGKGKVAVEANVTSPDLTHYRVRAAVKGEDVTVTLPRAGVDVETANGEVPVTVALEVSANGVALQRSEKGSPYSMLRFADQHPLLSRSGFLSIARLTTPLVTIAPLVGNLEIEQNVISLRQFEMGVRGGSITGQCGIVWEGPKSTLELHVRASGVQSSHGEPFDGNIAVAISAADRTIEGRAEILRIGERHLLDLLDLQDPQHVDPGMNRIRMALNFGYPDNLRLVFDHGFASAHLELGGLARLIRIGELRGIPMGPIVDKMLAPMLDGPELKETQ